MKDSQRRAMFYRLHNKSNLWVVHNPNIVRRFEGAAVTIGTLGTGVISVLPLPAGVKLAGEAVSLSAIGGAGVLEKAYSKYRNEYVKVLAKTHSTKKADQAVLRLHRRYLI